MLKKWPRMVYLINCSKCSSVYWASSIRKSSFAIKGSEEWTLGKR